MEIEPTPANEHLVHIYNQLPEDILSAEEVRIKTVISNLMGKLIAIEQVKETNNEHTVFA